MSAGVMAAREVLALVVRVRILGRQRKVNPREGIMSVEIPLKAKYKVGGKSGYKSGHNDGGHTGGKKGRGESGAGLQIRTEARKLAQVQTKENQMVLYVPAVGKRRFVRAKDLKGILNG